MTEPSLISVFVRPLNQLRIPYLITGGVASVIYGELRLTRDIDLIVRLAASDAPRFAGAWSPAEFYVPPVEVIAEESRRPAYDHFNVSHHETTMRADVHLPGNDPLPAWALGHPTHRRVDDDEVLVAPIEAVIVSKLRYYQVDKSDRHLRDIREMLRFSRDLVNFPELERWATRIGVEREWATALATPLDA